MREMREKADYCAYSRGESEREREREGGQYISDGGEKESKRGREGKFHQYMQVSTTGTHTERTTNFHRWESFSPLFSFFLSILYPLVQSASRPVGQPTFRKREDPPQLTGHPWSSVQRRRQIQHRWGWHATRRPCPAPSLDGHNIIHRPPPPPLPT